MPRKKTNKAAESGELMPNILFVGNRANAGVKSVSAKDEAAEEKGFVPREPLTKISEGMDTYKLPSAEEQLAGPFYHEFAHRIVRLYPRLYKNYVQKGD